MRLSKLSLVFCFLSLSASAQTAHFGIAEDNQNHMRYYTQPFPDTQVTTPGDAYTRACDAAFYAEIMRSHPAAQLSAYGCNQYASMYDAQQSLQSILNLVSNKTNVAVSWTYPPAPAIEPARSDVVVSLAMESVFTNDISTAKAAAMAKARQDYAGQITTFGTYDCLHKAESNDLWFCYVEFWVAQSHKVARTVIVPMKGNGTNRSEALFDAKQSALKAYPGEISRWTRFDCDVIQGNFSAWTCNIQFEAQVLQQ